MIRIDTSQRKAGSIELAVSGALDGSAVPVVDDAIAEAKSRLSSVVLNLRRLVAADQAGCHALLEWVTGGATLTECPAFLRRWIRAERLSQIHERARIRDAKSRRRRALVGAVTLAALIAPGVARAADDPPPGLAAALTFAEARARMLADNETARAAQDEVTERREERAATKSLYWPRVELHAQATHLNEEIVLDLDPIRQVINKLHNLPSSLLPPFESTFQKQDYWLSNITVTWPIYTGSRVQAANKAAELQIKDAEAAGRQTAGALTSDLVRRYFALRLALGARTVRASVLDGLNLHVTHAAALEREGQIARVERLHAEVARSDAERQLKAADHDVALARTALASLLSSDSAIDPASGLFLAKDIGPLDTFVARAMENHPGLARLDAQRGRAEQAVRAERGAWLPTVAAFGMRELHTSDLNIVSPTWAAGVTASFTLFDGMERGHRVAAARSQQSRVQLLDARARRDIATLVEQKYRTLARAREQFEGLDKTLELAAEMLRVRQRAFQEGMGTSIEVVDAQLALQGLQLQRLASAFDFDVALAELLEATGDADQFETHRAHADLDPEK
jgi:outer membrane protein TolC/ABC-type transporter Mla MlaB component